MENTDSRYPYTYACDLIRTAGGYGPSGTNMSRGDASSVRKLFSTVLKVDDKELAEKLADYYIANEKGINEQSAKDLLRELGLGISTQNEGVSS